MNATNHRRQPPTNSGCKYASCLASTSSNRLTIQETNTITDTFTDIACRRQDIYSSYCLKTLDTSIHYIAVSMNWVSYIMFRDQVRMLSPVFVYVILQALFYLVTFVNGIFNSFT